MTNNALHLSRPVRTCDYASLTLETRTEAKAMVKALGRAGFYADISGEHSNMVLVSPSQFDAVQAWLDEQPTLGKTVERAQKLANSINITASVYRLHFKNGSWCWGFNFRQGVEVGQSYTNHDGSREEVAQILTPVAP